MPVSTNSIANKMVTKPSSVTDMTQKLASKKLVNYIRYKGVSLTNTGEIEALNVIRKHRLWEVFLVKKLSFSWSEVHEVAEQLEHINSKKLIDKLEEFLDFPKYDPHGDPIPNKSGKLPNIKKQLLCNMKTGEEGLCVGVKNTSSDFLDFLDNKNIAVGKVIKVIEVEKFDSSYVIEINGSKIHISHKVSENIYIKY